MKLKASVSNVICFFIFVAIFHAQSDTHLTSSSTASNNYRSQDRSANRREEYRYMQQALGITKDGVKACFVTYESSDGTKIFTRTEYFRSAAEMKTHFEAKTKSFSEIIEKNDIMDGQGNIKGEKIVGKYSADEPEIVQYSIVRSHGYRVSYIESISLNHILDFEKRFYKSEK